MKYIRTKNGVYKIIRYYEPRDYYWAEPDSEEQPIPSEDIIKQSDSIEELCDEFVCNEMFVYNKTEMEWLIEQGNIVYGAIWCEFGLKYVAKMNDKGELELL